MEKVTEADFEKARKYMAIMNESYPGPTGNSGDQYQAKQQAHLEVKPVATFLIEYYFTVVQPEDGIVEPTYGEKPYGHTKKTRALYYIRSHDGHNGVPFSKRYPTLLEEAIQHYKAEKKKRLNAAKKEPLSTMTGEQLLLILQEHERRQKEGIDLTMPVQDEQGNTTQVYKNPFETLVAIENLEAPDEDEPGSEDGPAAVVA